MSAIKTVRYEAPAIYDEGDFDESSEYESEDYEEEEEEVEVEEAQQAGQDGEDGDVEYEVPYLDQQRQELGDELRKKKIPHTRVLPVADLPDDFEGEAFDGATYLALANRSNALLPDAIRRPLPGSEQLEDRDPPPAQPRASTSRHPALPTEAWSTVFPIHFNNYRKHIRNQWPPSPPLPYPEHLPARPRATVRGDVWQYIHGYRRKLREVDPLSMDKGKGKAPAPAPAQTPAPAPAPAQEGDDEEMAMDLVDDDAEAGYDVPAASHSNTNGHGHGHGQANGEVEEVEVDDEEEAMNSAPKPPRIKEYEPETERHRPHDPLVSVLQSYNSSELVALISQITNYMNESLDLLSPFIMIPQPPSSSRDNPLPKRYMYWLFTSLCLLDDNLDGECMSSIRELARACMKVAAWRWIRAVTDKEVTTDHVGGADAPASAEAGAEVGDGAEAGSGNNGGGGGTGNGGVGWKFGDTAHLNQGDAGLEETLGKCWILVYAVVNGWAQRDLLDDLEQMFR